MSQTEIEKFVHGNVFKVSINELTNNPNQPRKYFDEFEMKELEKSIGIYGILQPILVTLINDQLQIVAGERRWRAAISAGLSEVQVKYIEYGVDEIALVENLQRVDLLPVEKAEALLKMKELHGCLYTDIAQILSKSEQTVCEILSLNRLSNEIKEECRHNPKFRHTRLLKISKAKNLETMNKLFTDYKAELGVGEKRDSKKPKFTKFSVLKSQITKLGNNIKEFKVDNLNGDDLDDYMNSLSDLDKVMKDAMCDVVTMLDSVSRSFVQNDDEIVDDLSVVSCFGVAPEPIDEIHVGFFEDLSGDAYSCHDKDPDTANTGTPEPNSRDRLGTSLTFAARSETESDTN
jgi:ParB family chromosome partitioning protein